MGIVRTCCSITSTIPSNILRSVHFYKGTLYEGDNRVYNKMSYTLIKNDCKAFIKDNISFSTKSTMLGREQNTSQIAKEIILQFASFSNVYKFLVDNKESLYIRIYQELYQFLEFTTLTTIKINGKTYQSQPDKPFYQLALALKEYDFQG